MSVDEFIKRTAKYISVKLLIKKWLTCKIYKKTTDKAGKM